MVSRMYEGAEFSPDAFLAVSMGVGDVSMTLDTTAYLPDAPALVIINDATNPEVVLYTTKSSTVLGGLTRGISLNGAIGAAAAHDAGVAVYCGDTEFEKAAERENIRYLYAQEAIGVQWDRSGPDTTALTLIDVDGDPITTLPFDTFDRHRTFREIRRCLLSPAGTAMYGTNARGDGLTLDGTAGRVMVAIPKFWVKADNPATGIYRWWISPSARSGFEVHPAFRQRGGVAREYIYVSAYNACLQTRDFPVHATTTPALHSRTGAQPLTGDGAIKTMAFTSGGTHAPTLDETVTGATSAATGIVADWSVTAGTWAGGDAAGYLYLRQVSGTFGAENLNGSVAGSNFATGAATGDVAVDISSARSYAERVGHGWGLVNIWTWSAIVLLQMIEYRTYDMQSALGRGVCDLAQGTGFAGALNGADSADSVIGTNGTGTGTGTNGETPIVWRGIENLYGNVETFVDGIASTNAGRLARITPRAGTGDVGNPMVVGEVSIGTMPAANGSISDLLWEPLTRLLFLPKTAGGAVNTYLCDYYVYPFASPHSVMANGGQNGWYGGDKAGPFASNFYFGPADEAVTLGARLEYVGPEGGTPTTTTVAPGGGGANITVPAPVTVTTPSPVIRTVTGATGNVVPATVAPSTPNADPPSMLIMIETNPDGTLDGFFNGLGYTDTPGALYFTSGGLQTTAETPDVCMLAPAAAGTTPVYSAIFAFRKNSGLDYGANPYQPSAQGVPPGATVTGFTLKIWRGYTGAAPAYADDESITLRVNDWSTPGTYTYRDSSDKASATHWPVASTAANFLAVYGGPTDLWGLDPADVTPDKINVGVQVNMQFNSVANGGTAGSLVLYGVFLEVTYEV